MFTYSQDEIYLLSYSSKLMILSQQEYCWCTSVSNSYQTRYLLFSEPSLQVRATLDCCQKDTVSLEIFYSSWPEVSTWLFVHNYSDADYAGDPDNRQSTGGYCVYLEPNPLILFHGAPKLITPFLNPVLRQNTGNWHSPQLKFHGFVPCSVT
ncbi:PREDICTED: uncharacterized protein LOC101308484 isoform 1 [Fragaria vesca subsp. vesca]